MQIKVTGEKSFKVLKEQFIIGPSASGYTLAYSADNVHFTNYTEATPANENCIVNGAVTYSYWKLVGNTGEVDIIV